jgi:hypothetical protein
MGQAGLDYVLSGSYQTEEQAWATRDLTENVEQEIALLSDNIAAPTDDVLLSWIRFRWTCQTLDEPVAYEWYLLKCKSTDALQDLSDELVIEAMQRDKAILKRGTYILGYATVGYKMTTIQLYNVKLERGYELRLVIRPIISTGHCKSWARLEWRQVGV